MTKEIVQAVGGYVGGVALLAAIAGQKALGYDLGSEGLVACLGGALVLFGAGGHGLLKTPPPKKDGEL